MFACYLRLRHGERHRVLKLVAEAKSAACLIEGRASPHPTGKGLVEKPSVQQNVHGAVRCCYLNRSKGVVPETADSVEDSLEIRSPVLSEQRLRFWFRRRLAEKKDDF